MIAHRPVAARLAARPRGPLRRALALGPFTLLCAAMPAWAQFAIGAWQPAGHQLADFSFTALDATDLTGLGVDLLMNVPRSDNTNPPDHTQDTEEAVIGVWNNNGWNGQARFVVYYEPEDGLSPWGHTLQWFAGNPDAINLGDLDDKIDALYTRWNSEPAFHGYQIGHEDGPDGQGIYDASTYGNLTTVIQRIRARDPDHRIVAIGNVRDDQPPGPHWTSTPPGTSEQDLFRAAFFRPATEPGPANVLMHEDYRLWDSDNTEQVVQQAFDDMMVGWDRAGGMVAAAILENRRAEWHFIANVANQYDTPGQPPHYRDPTPEELRAQVNLALSRGAKGITYFLYTSSIGYIDGYQYEALVNTSSSRARIQPHWDTVRAVNDTLRPLGDAIYPLTWVDGFPQTSLPESFVVSATGERVEFGTFCDAADENRDYLLVVNRRDLRTPTSTQSLNVTLDADALQRTFRGPGVYYLTNVVSGERQVQSTDAGGQLVLRCPAMPPGAARLFRIERVSEWSGTVTLTGDVTIPAGTTLTIGEGTEVRVLTGDDLAGGTYPDGTEIIVQGVLNVNGSGEQPVVFRSADSPTSSVAWRGLRIGSGAGVQVSFAHTHVENPWPGIHLNGTPGLLNWGTDPAAATQISHCNVGIHGRNGFSGMVQNVDITMVAGAEGVKLDTCQQVTVRNVSVRGAGTNSIHVKGGSGHHLLNCTLIGSGVATGVYLGNTTNPEVMACHIENVDLGIQAAGCTGV
ncbi:MAG: right-handed parallel beta-helix repeat-containing protein [Candidatus Latescibacterota bacterium]